MVVIVLATYCPLLIPNWNVNCAFIIWSNISVSIVAVLVHVCSPPIYCKYLCSLNNSKLQTKINEYYNALAIRIAWALCAIFCGYKYCMILNILRITASTSVNGTGRENLFRKDKVTFVQSRPARVPVNCVNWV